MTDRCIDGRVMRHRPFPDDPEFEHDVGACPHCAGEGCAEPDTIPRRRAGVWFFYDEERAP